MKDNAKADMTNALATSTPNRTNKDKTDTRTLDMSFATFLQTDYMAAKKQAAKQISPPKNKRELYDKLASQCNSSHDDICLLDCCKRPSR